VNSKEASQRYCMCAPLVHGFQLHTSSLVRSKQQHWFCLRSGTARVRALCDTVPTMLTRPFSGKLHLVRAVHSLLLDRHSRKARFSLVSFLFEIYLCNLVVVKLWFSSSHQGGTSITAPAVRQGSHTSSASFFCLLKQPFPA
jgi:hypothetical protein